MKNLFSESKKRLDELRAQTLEQKVFHSMNVISSFVECVGGLDNVYVAYSGGKDSSVVLDIARMMYPNILAVFCMTGNEYPDVCRHVRRMRDEGQNVEIIRPKMTPREVWAKYGFPLVSKEVSRYVHDVRINPYSSTAQIRMGSGKFCLPYCWRWLVYEPFYVSHKCCDKLKKEPFRDYHRRTGRWPILGMLASESRLREISYLRHGGCNYYSPNVNESNPLSVWTEKDVLAYIAKRKIQLPSCYEMGISRTGCMGCGFGAHNEGDTRFSFLEKNYPNAYKMVMAYTNNGVTFQEAFQKVQEHYNYGKINK